MVAHLTGMQQTRFESSPLQQTANSVNFKMVGHQKWHSRDQIYKKEKQLWSLILPPPIRLRIRSLQSTDSVSEGLNYVADSHSQKFCFLLPRTWVIPPVNFPLTLLRARQAPVRKFKLWQTKVQSHQMFLNLFISYFFKTLNLKTFKTPLCTEQLCRSLLKPDKESFHQASVRR